MLMKLKMKKRFSVVLCICILLATCLSVPAVAGVVRHKSMAWSTVSVVNRDTITGFAGQSMLYAHARKSGTGVNITATGYVENIAIDRYSVEMEECFYCYYNGDSQTYSVIGTASTTEGQTPLIVSVSYAMFEEQNSSMLQLYSVDIEESYAMMTVDSICPYPQNLYYTDIYTLPSLAS